MLHWSCSSPGGAIEEGATLASLSNRMSGIRAVADEAMKRLRTRVFSGERVWLKTTSDEVGTSSSCPRCFAQGTGSDQACGGTSRRARRLACMYGARFATRLAQAA